MTAVYAPGRGR